MLPFIMQDKPVLLQPGSLIQKPIFQELTERLANGTMPQALTAFRAKMLAHLYVPARYACSPPGAIRRRRNWARRKQLVLLKALEARRRATTTTALARFLCRLCPEPQFRDIIGRL